MGQNDSQSNDTESVLLGYIKDCGLDGTLLDALHDDAQFEYRMSLADALHAQFETAPETAIKTGELVPEPMLPVEQEEEIPMTSSNFSSSNKKSKKQKRTGTSEAKKMKLSTDSPFAVRDFGSQNNARLCERVSLPLKFWFNAEKRGRLVRGFDTQKIQDFSGLSVCDIWKKRPLPFTAIFVKTHDDMLRVIICEGNHQVQSTITRKPTDEELTMMVPVYCIHLEEDFDALWSVAIPTDKAIMDACSTLAN